MLIVRDATICSLFVHGFRLFSGFNSNSNSTRCGALCFVVVSGLILHCFLFLFLCTNCCYADSSFLGPSSFANQIGLMLLNEELVVFSSMIMT